MPVSYDYREGVETEIKMETSGKIFYFDSNNIFECTEGRIVTLREVVDRGWFIDLEPQQSLRLDRVITFFGKPGPAYDEYDRLGGVCLECTGGYDLD
jgi:hypothetical protein